MKKLLFSTFLFAISFIFLSSYNASTSNVCSFKKVYKNISTKNMLDMLSYNDIKNIKKICTENICTNSLDANYKKLLSDHEEKIISSIKDNEKKINISLKGIKIDTIHFKDCIY